MRRMISLYFFIKLKKIILMSGCCIALIVFVFALNIYRSIELEMDIKPSMWSINAIPFALSKLVFNEERYTSNKLVAETFFHGRNTVSNNKGIDDALALDKSQLSENLVLWDAEDKGIIDYVSGAFYTFGFKAERIIYFYYLILFLSCSAFVMANYFFPSRLIILLQFLVLLFLVQPMVSFNPQLTSLVAPRSFPVLAIIASLHCMFFALNPNKKLLHLLLLGIQVSVVIFVIHLRIVTQWQAIAIGCACIVAGGINLLYKKKAIIFNFLPIVFVIIGFFGLNLYRHVVFPPAYFKEGQPITRVVWHNILSGLAFSPEIASRYNLKIDDRSIIDLVGAYLLEHNRYEQWVSLGVLEAGGREEGYVAIRWAEYDNIAKEVFFATCKTFPFQCLSASLYYKPLSLIKNLGWAYGLCRLPADLELYVSTFKTIGTAVKEQAIDTTHRLDKHRQRVYLWSASALLILAIPSIILITLPYDFIAIFTVVILAICSIIPSILAYSGLHTIIDTIIVFGILIYYMTVIMLRKLICYIILVLRNHRYSISIE